MPIDSALSFKITPRNTTLVLRTKRASLFENNPAETILGRNILRKMNSHPKRMMGIVSVRIRHTRVRVRVRGVPACSRDHAIFTRPVLPAPGMRASGLRELDFQFFAASKFFRKREFISAGAPGTTSRRGFPRGANFAAVCIRHYEGSTVTRVYCCANLKGIPRNGRLPLIMHSLGKVANEKKTWRTSASALNFRPDESSMSITS